MRRTNAKPLKELIDKYLKHLKIDKKLNEVKIIKIWNETVGKGITKSTRQIYIRDGVLYVYLNSAIIRQELSMVKEALVRTLNQRAENEIIKDIVFR